MSEQKFLLIPTDAANALLIYLMTKPMNEVEGIVNLLRTADVIEEKDLKKETSRQQPS